MRKNSFFNRLKGIIASAAAVVMAVGMSVAPATQVLADVTTGTSYTYTESDATTDGRVSISNAIKDRTYHLYKIFDATITSSGDGVVYYTTGTSLTWDTDSYFAVASAADSEGRHAVTQGSTTHTGAQIATYLSTKTSNFTQIGDGIKASESGTIYWDKVPYGYYIIVPEGDDISTAVLTIDTAKPTATVIDKNGTVTLDKTETIDSTEYYSGYQATDPDTLPTAQVGDTVSYKVTGNFTEYVNDGTELVDQLVFTDVMSDGLTANQDVVVKINDTTLTKDTDYTVTYTENATTHVWTTVITITTATDASDATTFKYQATNTYELTYSATVNERALGDTERNDVTLKYSDTLDDLTDWTKLKDYNLTIQKQDNAGNALSGAKFTFYRGSEEQNLVELTDAEKTALSIEAAADTKYYRIAVTGDSGASSTIDLSASPYTKAVIYGLDGNDTYKAVETKAPDGYVLDTTDKTVSMNNANATLTITNTKGNVLPVTGGMGTRLFYIFGGVIIAAALALLVAKKRREA